MTQTVIALFDNATEGQDAVERLVNEGLTRENIDISIRTGTDKSYMSNNNEYENDYKGDTKENGISRFFRSLFGNDDEADTYTKVAGRSSSIVTVHAQSTEEAQRAAEILDDCGAIDVNEKASQYGYTANMGSKRKDTMDSGSDNDSASIPIIEEQVQVGKREIETGGIRLKSRVVERPVEENLRLREERVTVERNAVDREATDEDLENFQETEMEIIEHAEVPVVSKEARVVEEVKLNKEVEHRNETVKETARKTEVDVENIEKKDGRNKKNKTNNFNN